jgi:hypothetical protein
VFSSLFASYDAALSGDTTFTTGEIIPFDDLESSDGIISDNAGGFTVPAAGTYLVSVVVNYASGDLIGLAVNGGALNETITPLPAGAPGQVVLESSLTLVQGDTITVSNFSGTDLVLQTSTQSSSTISIVQIEE